MHHYLKQQITGRTKQQEDEKCLLNGSGEIQWTPKNLKRGHSEHYVISLQQCFKQAFEKKEKNKIVYTL